MNDFTYLYELQLENVRSFKNKATIEFHDRADIPKACQWNIIIGDNGTGKTTILRALSLLDMSLNQYPFFEPLKSSYFYRDFEKKIKPFIQFSCINENGVLVSPEIAHLNAAEFITSKFQLEAFGYGASRKMGTRTVSAEGYGYTQNIWEENELPHADNWLMEAALRNKKTLNKRIEILKKLFKEEIKGIKNFSNDNFDFRYESDYNWVRLDDMSLGFRSLAAWVANFARGLENAYPNSKDFLAEPAILLLDEIDLHMHPKFQRHLLKFLGDTFPKTQFVVTAHSPLIVQAAADVVIDTVQNSFLSKKINLVLLKKKGDSVEVNNEPEIIQNWRLDQIVASDLFDLDSARPIETERLMMEKQAILAKYNRAENEEKRIVEIDKILGNIPYVKDKYETIANDILQKIAQIISK